MNAKKIRMQKGWSQRKLAEKTHLAFRTIQRLEWGTLDPRVSTIAKLGSALGHSLKTIERVLDRCIGEPENSLWSTAERTADESNRRWKLHLASFMDAFRRTPDPCLVASPLDPTLDTALRALFTSTAESLCEELRLPTPAWCLGVLPLEAPWFVAGVENLKATALIESPAHYRKRNIFVLGNFTARL